MGYFASFCNIFCTFFQHCVSLFCALKMICSLKTLNHSHILGIYFMCCQLGLFKMMYFGDETNYCCFKDSLQTHHTEIIKIESNFLSYLPFGADRKCLI